MAIDKSCFHCNLEAIPQSERQHYLSLRQEIFNDEALKNATENEDGYSIPITPELPSKIVEWLRYERACCPFFKFEIIFEPKSGPIFLKISGSNGVKTFLSELDMAKRS